MLYKNIKETNKSAINYFLIGLVFGVMVAWVVLKGLKKADGLDHFDWAYVGVFGLACLFFLFQGLNYIIRKAFMRVDDEKIVIKTDVFSKSETILWRDITSIKETSNRYLITRKDGSSYTLFFSYLSYDNAEMLRESILKTAKDKGIIVEKME